MHWPMTEPSRTLSAANSVVVPPAFQAVTDVIVGHRPGPALFHRQAGLGAVKRLDLRLLVNRQHQTVCGRVEIEPDHVAQLGGKRRVLRQLEVAHPMRLQPVRRPDPLHRAQRDAARRRHRPAGPVVASPGGSANVSSTTRSTSADGNGGSPGFRVLSWSRPATPSRMNRSCQRHTQGFETPARRMTSAVPQPSAVARMIRARQTCFCRLLRSATTATSCSRSAALTSILIPSRIAHYRMRRPNVESYDCVVSTRYLG